MPAASAEMLVSVGRADDDRAHPFKPRPPHHGGKRVPAAHALAVFGRMEVIRIVEVPASRLSQGPTHVVLPAPATPRSQ